MLPNFLFAILAFILCIPTGYLVSRSSLGDSRIGTALTLSPLIVFWLIGAMNGGSALSAIDCATNYELDQYGRLIDWKGDQVSRFKIGFQCITSLLLVLFMEMVWGAWLFTIPFGMMVVYDYLMSAW